MRLLVNIIYRPCCQRRFGVSLIPVAAVIASCLILVVEDTVNDSSRILRTEIVILRDLIIKDRTDVVLCQLTVKQGCSDGCLPGIPCPQTDKPLIGHGRNDTVMLQGTGCASPVGSNSLNGFHRCVLIFFTDLIGVCKQVVQVSLPALAVFCEIIVTVCQHVCNLRIFRFRFLICKGKALG